MDVEELNSTEFSAHVSSSTNTEEIYVYDEDGPCTSISLIDDTKLNDAKSCKSNSTVDSYLFNTDIFEDNNDSNNNSDSNQSSEEGAKPILSLQNDTCKVRSIKSLSNPTSEHSNILRVNDNIELDTLNEKLKEEAVLIHTILPKYTYQNVFKMLSKNQYAENRIELTLWDLLPIKRPREVIGDPLKRKCRNNNSGDLLLQGKDDQNEIHIDWTKHSNTQSDLCNDGIILNDTSSEREYVDNTLLEDLTKDSKVLQSIQNGILRPAKLIVDDKSSSVKEKRPVKRDPLKRKCRNNNSGDLLLQGKDDQNEIHIDWTKHSNIQSDLCNDDIILNDTSSEREYGDNTLLEDLTKDSKVLQSIQNGILRPAKLIVDDKSSSVKDVIMQQHESNVYKQTFENLKKQKTNKLTNKNLSFGRNVFMSSSNNTNNFQAEMLHTYMNYLDFMQNVKKQKLSGTYKHTNFSTQNNLSSAKSQKLNKNDLRLVNTRKMSETLNVDLTDKEADRINSKCSSFSYESNITAANTQISSQDVLPNTAQCSTLSDTATNDLAAVTITDSNTSLNTELPLNIEMTNSNIVTSQAMPVVATTSSGVYHVRDTNKVFGGTRRKTIERNTMKSGKTGENKKYIEKEDNILDPDFEVVYDELQSIFPRVDKNYIKQVCREHLNKEDVVLDLESQRRNIVRILKNYEREHLIKTKTLETKQKDDCVIDEKYTYLSGIFPNADPVYLKKVVLKMHDNTDALSDFIHTQWKQPTYPTKEEKLNRIRITEQQMQYTNKFNVKQFLEIFPDPFKYFEDPHRVCKYSSDALEFLKFHFKQFQVETLSHEYTRCSYNLTQTVRKLEDSTPDKVPDNCISLWERNLSEDIPLLQECAFIKHKNQIRECVDKLKEEESKKFEELKKRRELLECQCCYNDECMPSKCSTCDDGHIFCDSCVLSGTETKLANGETRISCFVNCDGEFSLSTLQKVLSPTQFSILIHKKQEAEVMAAGLEGLVSCPFCHFASIPPAQDKVFKCLNPHCMKESCRLCKELNHVPLKCYEEKTDKARLLLEEKMTEALVRKCYNCGRPYYKEDGCNKITCTCGAIMCYLCDKQITGYDHFKDNYGRAGCPLWSDNHSINNATVQAVAENVVKHIKETVPNVDADDLLKNLKKERHSGVGAIADRVKQVTKFDK